MNKFYFYFLLLLLFSSCTVISSRENNTTKKYDSNIVIIEFQNCSSNFFEEIGPIIEKIQNSRLIVADFIFSNPSQKLLNALEKNNVSLISGFQFNKLEKREGGPYEGKEPSLPNPIYQKYLKTGYVNVMKDSQNKIKEINLNFSEEYNALIDEAYYELTGKLHNKPNLTVHFCLDCFKTYSSKEVLEKNISFEDKIVFLGSTDDSFGDFHYTYASEDKLPGVEIHANALNTLLIGNLD